MRAEFMLALVGLLFTAGGSYFVFNSRRIAPVEKAVGWIPGQGTIVDWQTEYIGPDRDPTRFPVVEYVAPAGRTHRFTNPTTLDIGIYRTGRRVAILIDPTDTSRAQLANTAATARLLRGVHTVMGAIFIVVGVLLMVAGGAVWWFFGR